LFQDLVPENRIFVVPNGRDFEMELNSGASTQTNEIVRVLYLSNFVRTKGVLDVLQSIPLVCRNRKDVEFIFAGDWNDEAVKREMEELILQYRDYPIKVVGKVSGSAKYDLLKQADIFVFPTYYPPEGHPWAIVEAMAAGLPVISTNQGAITESVIEGRNGFFVEKRDIESIADRILFLCNHAEERKRMGVESRRLYEQEFTERRLVDRMAGVFHAVLAGDGG
jgi:glycosyltransferase involved in cell wall biosynthesis